MIRVGESVIKEDKPTFSLPKSRLKPPQNGWIGMITTAEFNPVMATPVWSTIVTDLVASVSYP